MTGSDEGRQAMNDDDEEVNALNDYVLLVLSDSNLPTGEYNAGRSGNALFS